jgi:hypothetical protein
LKVQPEERTRRRGVILALARQGRYTPPKAKHMAAGSPIAHKYREGKIKSTLKRESKELEVVEREAIEAGHGR